MTNIIEYKFANKIVETNQDLSETKSVLKYLSSQMKYSSKEEKEELKKQINDVERRLYLLGIKNDIMLGKIEC